MRTIKHPLSGALYDLDDDGHIVVTLDDKTGIFTKEGVWLSGEIRTADAHFCAAGSAARTCPRLPSGGRVLQGQRQHRRRRSMTVTENRAHPGPLDRVSRTNSCSTRTAARCPMSCAGSPPPISATRTTR